MSDLLLEIKDVTKSFRIGGLIFGTELLALDHVTLSLDKQKPSIMSIVGESGSGKTTLAKLILKLHAPTSGDILLDGKSIFGRQNGVSELDYLRNVQPIFQNPFETFSARKPVETYLYDTALKLKVAKNKNEARDVIAAALTSVGLDLKVASGKYAHQFSGGELQRISIARGLIPRPKLIVADEPVSMIDASLRMNIVNLFLQLKETYNVSFLYITHDLSTAYYMSDFIGVMYRGNLVEYGPSDEILTNPQHPYTQLLLDSVPMVGKKWTRDVKAPDVELKEYLSAACKFAGRCPFARDICRETKPPMVTISETRQALCYKPVDYEPGRTVAKTETIAAS
jgi:peptide/nickel transport system ATP-binding protein